MKRLVKVNALRRVLHTRFSSLKTDDTGRLDEVIVDFVDDTGEEARAETEYAVMDEFERNLFTKRKEVNEMTGLKLLIEKYETRLSELETQMSEVKRKLETVTEALRLLKEEGILEDDPKPHWP
jgi:predicted RNase H-like nuclease (RuvC/YqgF family)